MKERILDTTKSLTKRSLDIIQSTLLDSYFGEHDRYPKNYEGIIVKPLGVDAFEAELFLGNGESFIRRFGRKKFELSVKIPKRGFDENNII